MPISSRYDTIAKNGEKMKKIFFAGLIIASLTYAANAGTLYLTCVDYDVAANIHEDRVDISVNGESMSLQKISDKHFKNENIAFAVMDNQWALLHLSGNENEPDHASPCVDKFLSADCDVKETVNLKCVETEDIEYNVTAKVCADRAVLNIDGKQSVLPRANSIGQFFPKADASFISGDIMTGFVINHNESEDWPGYGNYIIKINGNKYPLCEKI